MENKREIPLYRYRSKKATELASMIGIQHDLKMIQSSLSASLTSDVDDVRYALFVSALIFYRRCFNNSARNPLKREILQEIRGGEEYHEFIIGLADKYAAHSVNIFEENAIGIAVDNNEVVGTGHMTIRFNSWDAEGINQMIRFSNEIERRFVAPVISNLYDEIELEARSRPISQIIRADRLMHTAPGPEAANQKRPD